MKCGKHMRGSIVETNGELCHFRNDIFTGQTGLVEPWKCSFKEYSNPGVKASMMFRSYIPQVSVACRKVHTNVNITTKSVSLYVNRDMFNKEANPSRNTQNVLMARGNPSHMDDTIT